MLSRRGQAAVEMIILLGITLVIFSSVLTFSIDATERSDETVRLAQAQAAVQDVTEAADSLYAEGVGAKTEVYVTIPSGMNPEGTYLASNVANLNLYVRGNPHDIPASSKATLCGELPTTPGGHRVMLQVRDACIHVGEGVLLITPGSLDFLTPPGNTDTQQISVTNGGSEAIEINTTWDQGDIPDSISVGILPSELSLGVGDSSTVGLSVTVPLAAAYGTYVGWMTVEVIEDGDVVDSEVVSVEITVSLVHTHIMLYPTSWDAGPLVAGEDASKVFTVCNNGDEYQIVNISVNESGSISMRALTGSVELGQLTLINTSLATAIQDDSTDSTTDVNISDGNRANINSISAANPHWIDINYTATIPPDMTVAYARVYVEHYEGDASVVPEVQWWDGSVWQAICTLPDRVTLPNEGVDNCDLSGYIDSVSEASQAGLRIYYTNQLSNKNGYLDAVRLEVGYGTVTEIRGTFAQSVLTGADIGACNTTPVYIYTFESDEAASHSYLITAVADIGEDNSSVSFSIVGVSDSTPPNVTGTAVNTTSAYVNDSLCVNATVLESALDSVWAHITEPSGVEVTHAMTDTGCGMPPDDDIYGVSVPLDEAGTWTVNTTFANDTSGNLGNQTPYSNIGIEVSTVQAPVENVSLTLSAYNAWDDGTDSETDDTAEVQSSDNDRGRIKVGAMQTKYLWANFSAAIPDGSTINAVNISAEHYETSLLLVFTEVKWWDGDSWEHVCYLPYRGSGQDSEDTDVCDLSGIDTVPEANDIQVQIQYFYLWVTGNASGYVDLVNLGVSYSPP